MKMKAEVDKMMTLETKTIIFDLEETLLHISMKTEGADLVVPVRRKNGASANVG